MHGPSAKLLLRLQHAGVGRFDFIREPGPFFLYRSPVPILACENFGLISAPRLPQTLQTKSGSTSDSLMLSGQRSGVAHFAEGDFLRIGRHGTYLGTMHLRATVFRTASVITTADPLTISYLP